MRDIRNNNNDLEIRQLISHSPRLFIFWKKVGTYIFFYRAVLSMLSMYDLNREVTYNIRNIEKRN